ncbi:MAG: YicC/YloC family endoribonuclease [Ignavibacteria bacterium]|nr:YicC family protein [Ignavibacteriota bacterium]
MIISMTGFGNAEGVFRDRKYSIEIRSVNNRFSEISFKYPKYLSSKDFELKEIVRKKISRGKVNIFMNVDAENETLVNLDADENIINEYFGLIKKIKKIIGTDEEIKIEHILTFSDLFTSGVTNEIDEEEFNFICDLLNKALDDVNKMKVKEGESLKKDILERIKFIEKESAVITKMSKDRIKAEKDRLRKKVETLVSDKRIIDENRLELEVVLLADKIDITEEVIRLRSHTKYFTEYSKSKELAGRRLNFLIQELNREVNTIASKSTDAEISQKSARLKEELEKIREQLQNVE